MLLTRWQLAFLRITLYAPTASKTMDNAISHGRCLSRETPSPKLPKTAAIPQGKQQATLAKALTTAAVGAIS